MYFTTMQPAWMPAKCERKYRVKLMVSSRRWPINLLVQAERVVRMFVDTAITTTLPYPFTGQHHYPHLFALLTPVGGVGKQCTAATFLFAQ